ncbi:centrosome-associated protein 350 isoform X2 [Polyodon spathula]|uniref:centrosome-associated protein 350 isoform X2 n=1 Tax=Polyodon spathula TaxID=7913 RepID=UPI001B7E25F1|nr:centrosome-associated protein 350 isoform X2 [Polyodon spathula]
MWSSKASEAPLTALSRDSRRELSTAWDSLNQTKATLRHIENRLEAAPSTTAVLDSVMDTKKSSGGATRKISRKDGRYLEESCTSASAPKPSGRSRARREKPSRSPLRATTLEMNVKRSSRVEFREPLASYRDPAPPYLTSSQLDAASLTSDLPSSEPLRADRLSRMIYERDTRDSQSRDMASTHSSAIEDTVVRYLNDRPALDALHTSQVPRCNGYGVLQDPSQPPVETQSQSSSPGSTSHRLEILRRRQHDDKLEKLKERIRKQREQSEESAERERLAGYLEQPVGIGTETAPPTAKVRKVATAPPAPTYKGFNPTETKMRTPDGKVWREQEFHNLSREIYRDLSLQLAESTKAKDKPDEKSKGMKAAKPVRKVHKAARSPSPDTKPGAHVINAASWREGQKLVKMVLGPAPKTLRERRAASTDRAGREGASRAGPMVRSDSDTRLESTQKSRKHSVEQPKSNRAPQPEGENSLNKDFLPADIRGILDDLQLDSRAAASESRPAGRKVGTSSRLSRSASPAKRKQETGDVGPKKRHYDSDSVRQFIVRQQEERKKKQTEEKRAQREEAECRTKRLQELYKKQKEAFAKSKLSGGHVEVPAQKRLQETYSKLLLEQAQLEELPQALPVVESQQPRPVYQPSGESDKENKGHNRPLSASSSSDLSLSEPQQQQPPLTRTELTDPPRVQPDRLSPALPAGNLFTQLLSLEQRSLLQKEFESVLSSHRREGAANRSQPSSEMQPYPSSSNFLSKTTAQYRTKINRIEALKATAASLSTRIESEARKLAGAGINHGCIRDSERDILQDDGRWASPVSPPVRESSDPSDRSTRIQRVLGVGHTSYEGVLPGVGNLYEFKRPPRPQAPRALLTDQEGVQERPPRGSLDVLETTGLSSGGSISEGPLLSEGSLSGGEGEEEEGRSAHLKDPLKLAKRLKETEFCVAETNTFRPIVDFQKEAERYPPFTGQSGVSRGPWEELAKGSPHSVINIFTKNFQSYGKVLEEKSERGSPALHQLLPGSSPVEAVSYEDDFISSRSSGSLTGRMGPLGLSNDSSGSSPQEELPSLRSPFEVQLTELTPHHSSGSSPRSSASSRKRGGEVSEENKAASSLGKRGSQGKPSPRGADPGQETDSTLEDISAHSLDSVVLESVKSGRSLPSSVSPASSASQKGLQGDGPAPGTERCRTATGPNPTLHAAMRFRPPMSSAFTELRETSAAGSLQFSPGVLQQRLTAELSYLDAMEESVRQLSDVERTRGVSLAQQESVSLAQILKAQQQRHERDLSMLKLKAEQEALDTQRQLDESRQKAAQAHAESQQNMAQSRQEAAEALQHCTNKMISQQAEAVRYTADAARHIKEMTEMARSQIAGALNVPAAPITALYDQQRQQHSSFMKQLRTRTEEDSRKSEFSPPPVPESKRQYSASFDSFSESSRSKNRDVSSSSSRQGSPSLPSSERKEKPPLKEMRESSVEEDMCTAADDSLHSDSVPSLQDEKDSTSIATEYSLKFDESMTEDEIEEKSFRSLLPSESHRRFTLEKKRGPHEDSDEEPAPDKPILYSVKDGSMPFSSGQDSFSRFTMEMVRQYMKEEEVRAHHQSSLLRLREKALKEKTKAELAWLEHQKQRLRHKGEDDKMPPIRKRQRGLLLRLQQEQAEIKRLQEANKAARKERQLIMKQQQEIQRMRQTTIKLHERLKLAGGAELELPSSDTVEEDVKPSTVQTELETRSPSPLSVSGSETSSIMQKLKKMRSHMDEKHCSPVHYFFSVFTSDHWASLSVCFPNLHPKFQLFIYNQLVRFLTKREQKLMQRRRHAEELLQWKRRLDAEEAEIRRMEKLALAAWDRELQRQGSPRGDSEGHNSPEHKEPASEEESAPEQVLSHSSAHSDSSVPEEVGSPPAQTPSSELQSSAKDCSPREDSTYSPDFDSPASASKRSPPSKASLSISEQEGSGSNMQLKPTLKSRKVSGTWSDKSPSITHSEAMSEQSDIESRIRALKGELRQRKHIVQQLKREQKNRQKERLKAQEASLLKQLESYDDFIEKTKAELNKELNTSQTTKPQIKTPSSVPEKPRVKPPTLHSPETRKNWKIVTESAKPRSSLESSVEHENVELSSTTSDNKCAEGDVRSNEPSASPSPALKFPDRSRQESADILESLSLSPDHRDVPDGNRIPELPASRQEEVSEDDSVVSSQRSDILEELEHLKAEESETEDGQQLFQLNLGRLTPHEERSSMKEVASSSTYGQMDLTKEAVGLQDVRKDSKEEVEEELEEVGSEHSIDSVKSVKLDIVGNREQSPKREQSYSTDFDMSSPEKEPSVPEQNEVPHVMSYRDDFESSSGYSPRKASYSENCKNSHTSSTAKPESKQEEPLLMLERSQVRSPAEGSEEEISEQLSEKSFSSCGSFHSSERLLEIRSPTEDYKGKERSDGEQEAATPVPSPNTSPSLTPPSGPRDSDLLPDFTVGDRVLVSNVQPGTLRFKGKTKFANGYWAGVELDKSEGSNNGTYDGVVYFECQEQHGIFAPPHKISRLPEKFEIYMDTTEDEDSFFDDQSEWHCKGEAEKEEEEEPKSVEQEPKEHQAKKQSQDQAPQDKIGSEDTIHQTEILITNLQEIIRKTPECVKSFANELDSNNKSSVKDSNLILNEANKQMPNFVPEDTLTPEIKSKPECAEQVEKPWSTPLLDHLTREKDHLEPQFKPPVALEEEPANEMKQTEEKASAFADRLLGSFVNDAVRQLQEIKAFRNEKIAAANVAGSGELADGSTPKLPVQPRLAHDGLTGSVLGLLGGEEEEEKEEPSSPELCPRPESPVFGASGQEELAKRLAELELSRELLDVLGDEQDWFDEDFGLSSRKEQQKQKQQEGPGQVVGDQPKPSGRPALPPLKPREEPLLVVPHNVPEVERLVHEAAEELWKWQDLGHSVQDASAPAHYLGNDSKGQDIDSISKHSYKRAVFDLTRQIFQEIFAEDPNTNQPQWMKPSRMNSSYYRRVKNPNDIKEIKTFISAEVLKLYGLRKDQHQKTDWQKMLKFGRKKRDRVDHILVQELHEEESQWVNYDEDELFVKMQLADGIFDALLKDTAEVLNQIQDKKAKVLPL